MSTPEPAQSKKTTSEAEGKRVVVCACEGAETIPPEKLEALRQAFTSEQHQTVEWVPDLCRIAAREPEKLKELCSGAGATVVACYPRTVHALCAWAGVEEPEKKVDVLNLRTLTSEAVAEALEAEPSASQPVESDLAQANGDDWIPWYPIIDPERCVDCKQCLNFCLFGVYGKDESGHVAVTHPDACKTNCPACARVCPQAAIIFPKYAHAPINGAAVGDLAQEKEKIKIDMDKLIKGNVHATLAARKLKRQQLTLLRKQQ